MKNLWLIVLLSLSACTHIPTQQERSENAIALANKAGWKKEYIETNRFTLAAFLPTSIPTAELLTIYIEGDGLSWIDASTPSNEPTPMDPLALKLALRDDAPSAYLARPCQYVAEDRKKSCAQKYWTHSRFSEEVIEASNLAIDQLKHKFAAKKLLLVGYSGGGAVAALIAARRLDVVRLITLAGNIDHRAWTRENHLSPLSGSLNPADEWLYLQHIPQTHFVGGNDEVIGEYVARSYASHFPADLQPSIVVVPQYDHHCCWVESWPALKKDAVSGTRHN